MKVIEGRRITKKMIKEMQELRKQGVTGIEIAKRYGISETFAYIHTKGYGVKKVTKVEQIRKLRGTMTVTEIADKVGVEVSYVSQVLAIKEEKWGITESEKEKTKKKKTEKDLSREEEVKKIGEKVRKEKEEKEKEYKKQLAEEVKRLKERFKGIAI